MLTLTMLMVVGGSGASTTTAAELVQRGEATRAKIAAGGVHWLVRQKLGKAKDFGVRGTRFGTSAQFDFVLFDGDAEVPLLTISQRAGVWATSFPKSKEPMVTRPYELFLPLMSAYLLLAKCTPTVITTADALVPVRESKTTSTWLASRDPKLKEALDATLEKLKSVAPENPAVPALEQKLAELPLVEVENATGAILHAGLAQRGLFYSELEVLTKKPASLEADLPEPPPPMSAEFLASAIAIGWDPSWKPGSPGGDTDALLLNFDHPEDRRRVPNRYGLSFQPAFLSPRSRMVVTTSLPTGGFRPLLIDLLTGENKLLGDAWGAMPVVMFPVASPDAKKISVLSQAGSGVLSTQLQVIDVATGTVRNVGAPADQAFVSWLPDDGFLLERRIPSANEKEKELVSRVVRLSSEGKETVLLTNARRPLLLSAKEFLYQDVKTRQWMISDLAGKKTRLLGDGLAKLSAPTISPDGKVLLMMEPTPAPQPRLVDLATGEVLEASFGSGLWAFPQWR